MWDYDSNIRSTKGVNNHSNIPTVVFTEVLSETFNLIFKLIRNGNVYSKVPNKRGVSIKQGGWKSVGGGISGRLGKCLIGYLSA